MLSLGTASHSGPGRLSNCSHPESLRRERGHRARYWWVQGASCPNQTFCPGHSYFVPQLTHLQIDIKISARPSPTAVGTLATRGTCVHLAPSQARPCTVSLKRTSFVIDVHFANVVQSLFDPMDCSTPGSSVLHYLPEFAQTHVHWVSDAIRPSHPLLPPFPPVFNLSQHQGVFQWVGSSHHVAEVLELQLQHRFFQWIFRVDFL